MLSTAPSREAVADPPHGDRSAPASRSSEASPPRPRGVRRAGEPLVLPAAPGELVGHRVWSGSARFSGCSSRSPRSACPSTSPPTCARSASSAAASATSASKSRRPSARRSEPDRRPTALERPGRSRVDSGDDRGEDRPPSKPAVESRSCRTGPSSPPYGHASLTKRDSLGITVDNYIALHCLREISPYLSLRR